MWFASMWLGMLLEAPSLPHMLQVASLWPSLVRTSANVIIDLICSSSWLGVALVELLSKATTVPGSKTVWLWFPKDFLLSFNFSFITGGFLKFDSTFAAVPSWVFEPGSPGPVRPFNLSKSKKRLKVGLENICLAEVEKVNNGRQIFRFQTSHVYQRVGMSILLQKLHEKWTRSCKDDLVPLHLSSIFTHQGHISEVFVIPQFPKRRCDIIFKVIPLETKLLWNVHSLYIVVIFAWDIWMHWEKNIFWTKTKFIPRMFLQKCWE